MAGRKFHLDLERMWKENNPKMKRKKLGRPSKKCIYNKKKMVAILQVMSIKYDDSLQKLDNCSFLMKRTLPQLTMTKGAHKIPIKCKVAMHMVKLIL